MVSLAIDRIQKELDLNGKVRKKCKADLEPKSRQTAVRIYTHADHENQDMNHPSELIDWSANKTQVHYRLIDRQDKYEHPTQIPAAYPGLHSYVSLQERFDPTSAESIREKTFFDHLKKEAQEREACGRRKKEAREKKALHKDPNSEVLTPPTAPTKHKSTSDESTSATKKVRSGVMPGSMRLHKLSVQDDEIEATDDVKSRGGRAGKRGGRRVNS